MPKRPLSMSSTEDDVVCTINPNKDAIAESTSTLLFAQRIKRVQLHAKKKEVVDTDTLLERYRREIEELKQHLAEREVEALVRSCRLSAREQLDESKAMHDLNARIRQLTNLILTNQSVHETKGDESQPVSPAMVDIDMSPYQLQQELLAARRELETQSTQILSLEDALLTHSVLPSATPDSEKDKLLADQAKMIKELEMVVKGYEDNFGGPSSSQRADRIQVYVSKGKGKEKSAGMRSDVEEEREEKEIDEDEADDSISEHERNEQIKCFLNGLRKCTQCRPSRKMLDDAIWTQYRPMQNENLQWIKNLSRANQVKPDLRHCTRYLLVHSKKHELWYYEDIPTFMVNAFTLLLHRRAAFGMLYHHFQATTNIPPRQQKSAIIEHLKCTLVALDWIVGEVLEWLVHSWAVHDPQCPVVHPTISANSHYIPLEMWVKIESLGGFYHPVILDAMEAKLMANKDQDINLMQQKIQSLLYEVQFQTQSRNPKGKDEMKLSSEEALRCLEIPWLQYHESFLKKLKSCKRTQRGRA